MLGKGPKTVTYHVKFYLRDCDEEVFVDEQFDERQDANSAAAAASRHSKNPWSAASVWKVDNTSGTQTFLDEYQEGKRQ